MKSILCKITVNQFWAHFWMSGVTASDPQRALCLADEQARRAVASPKAYRCLRKGNGFKGLKRASALFIPYHIGIPGGGNKESLDSTTKGGDLNYPLLERYLSKLFGVNLQFVRVDPLDAMFNNFTVEEYLLSPNRCATPTSVNLF